MYLDEIGSIPLLTATQEVDMAKRVEAGLYAAELLRAGTAKSAPRGALEAVAEEGRRAKASMISANLRLVVSVVKHHNNGRLSLLDAIQEGNLGLIRAVEKFDYTKGYKFSTYATWWIRQAAGRAAGQTRSVRLPAHVEEQVNEIRAVHRSLAVRLGHEPTTHEIAAESGLPVDRVHELRRVARPVVSLDLPAASSDAETPLGELIEDTQLTPAAAIAERAALAIDVRQAVALLPCREQRAVIMRYGLATGRSATLREIADDLGISKERARQFVNRGLSRLRNPECRPSLLPWAARAVAGGEGVAS
jgi:RNA polymerase primary sigma factor/RNA polymerase nonessential primary-like sigma factor